jgi:hypothetical protein
MNQAIKAYQEISFPKEFRELERLRSLTRHNEASARQQEREKWQGVVKSMENVVADKDTEIARLRAELNRVSDTSYK